MSTKAERRGWNYRMFHRTVDDGLGDTTDEFTIREAYYDADGNVTAWGSDGSAPYGETKHDLMEDVTHMAAAISQPVVNLTPDGEHLAAEQPTKAGLRR